MPSKEGILKQSFKLKNSPLLKGCDCITSHLRQASAVTHGGKLWNSTYVRHRGGCSSPKTGLGPLIVPLLLHQALIGLLIPADLSYLNAESRIWKHQAETQLQLHMDRPVWYFAIQTFWTSYWTLVIWSHAFPYHEGDLHSAVRTHR